MRTIAITMGSVWKALASANRITKEKIVLKWNVQTNVLKEENV